MKNNLEKELKEELITEKSKKKIINTRIFRTIWNRYFILSVAFIVWMFFFDQNSFFIHKELNKQLHLLEMDKYYFEKKLKEEKDKLNELNNNPAEIERIAREQHFLKKEDEDIFIVQEEKIEVVNNN